MKSTVLKDIERHASERPDQPAIREQSGNTVSYRELRDDALTWKDRFVSSGIETGDLCGFMASQGATYVAASLGLLAAGGGLVPIPEPHREKTDSIYLRKLPLDYLIDENDEFQPRVVSEVNKRRKDRWSDIGIPPAYVRFTSGTTGERRGVVLGHETIRERTAAANRALRISPEDRVLWMLSMDYHFVVSVLLYLRNGATLLIPEHVLADPVLSFAEENGATVLYATPYHYRLLNGSDRTGCLPNLRMAISTAEGISRETAGTFYQSFNCPISQALGIMEAGLPAVNLDAPRDKPGSVGQVLPDYEVTLVNDRGEPVPDSSEQAGEIHVDGPGLLDAYLRPRRTREQVLTKHGFPTGDQGRFDDDGDLYVVGRRANRINRAGNKFFCEEVEQVIDRHPDVRESRVYPESHPELGQLPYAEYVPVDSDSPPSGEELKAHCGDRLAGYKVPREFRETDEIPRTPTGKIKRS